MFGRLGSVVGANTAASLLDNHCETIFYLSATSLIGEIYEFKFTVPQVSLNSLKLKCHTIFRPKNDAAWIFEQLCLIALGTQFLNNSRINSQNFNFLFIQIFLIFHSYQYFDILHTKYPR